MDEADPEDLAWGPIPGDERIKFYYNKPFVTY